MNAGKSRRGDSGCQQPAGIQQTALGTQGLRTLIRLLPAKQKFSCSPWYTITTLALVSIVPATIDMNNDQSRLGGASLCNKSLYYCYLKEAFSLFVYLFIYAYIYTLSQFYIQGCSNRILKHKANETKNENNKTVSNTTDNMKNDS